MCISHRFTDPSFFLYINNKQSLVQQNEGEFSVSELSVIFCSHNFYLWSLPPDPGLQLQLSHRELIVHEESVPVHGAQLSALGGQVAGHQFGQPAAGLGAEQLIGGDRVHIVEGALRGHTQ